MDAQIEPDNPIFFFFWSVSHRVAVVAMVRYFGETYL